MADRAVVRVLIGRVVGRAIVIGLVAGPAVRRRSLELSVNVALRAGHRNVGAGQGERRAAVIKLCRGPAVGVMADRAVVIVIAGHMIRIADSLVIGLVTGPAVRWRAHVLPVDMALYAGHGHVCPGERELTCVVIKCGRAPACGGVTSGALTRKLVDEVIGQVRSLVGRRVTGPAVRRQILELPVRMTLGASDRNMRARERETGSVVIEPAAVSPARRIVTDRAVVRIVPRDVILRPVVIRLVT